MKTILTKVNKEMYGSIPQQVQQAWLSLETLQMGLLQNPGNPALMLKEKEESLHEYISIRNAGNAFMNQKQRNKWLNLRDKKY